jgi:hypothetical protein
LSPELCQLKTRIDQGAHAWMFVKLDTNTLVSIVFLYFYFGSASENASTEGLQCIAQHIFNIEGTQLLKMPHPPTCTYILHAQTLVTIGLDMCFL